MVVLSWSSSLIIKSDCPTKCGEIPISFPFGIGAGCYLDDRYAVNCRSGKPFLASLNLELLNISLEANTILVNHPVFNTCVGAASMESANLENSPFFFSHTRNILSGRGCYFLAYINHNEIYAGCYSSCSLEGDPTAVCLGINCCQSRIPLSLQLFKASVETTTDDDDIVKQCKLVFVVQEEWIVRKKWNPGNSKAVPVVLDWGIHNSSFHPLNITTSTSHCNDFANSTSTNATFANKSFSTSTTASNSLVHQCSCKGGFQGNPYLLQGCQDIDECKNKSICTPKMSCRNVIGSYECYPRLINTTLVILGVATGLPSLLLVLLGACRLHILIKRRKNIKLKEKYFKCLLMQQHLTSYDGCGDRGKLFKSKELDKATNHFNVDRILGRGGQGTVYKGMLADGKIIAVKKPKAIDERKLEEFINEVAILSQINHRNVVKLLGCCLETEVPLLVYEFIPNGTLYQYLHAQNEEFPLTWERRLQIAVEVAEALSYLHSAASLPIYHRDVKSANILLDDKYRAKVADFGTSRSIAIDQTHVTTKVQGTFGYLDPEYFRSSQFTDKSDVYSFGVVLLELLTGQKPIFSIGLEEGIGLVTHFMVSMQEDNLFDILDPQVKQLGKKEEIVTIADLAKSCLNMNGKKRPMMKEVAMVLEGIQASQKDNGNVQQDYEEVEHERTEITEGWDVISTSTEGPITIGVMSGASTSDKVVEDACTS
ncbi:hypothetical protein Dsin_026877 [Dipteronia sinensis]|uniref:Protein kinase domain-containing protein n=1 Tax=Dipteronia sinensis TaxID=43782 RepID=A0AAD9ZZ22_9ROSI|nr:hypothetical protein Dsin_026877 [Dipteronia sinensis]